MTISNEKRKYKIIYIIVTVVMCLRCIGIELPIDSSFDNVLSLILMIVWIIVYCIWGLFVVNRIYEGNNKLLFVILIAFSILSASIMTGADYIGTTQAAMLIVTIIDVYIVATDGYRVFMIILPVIGLLCDSSYLFEYMGSIFVLLIVNSIRLDKKKYRMILIINAIEAVGIYIYHIVMGNVISSEIGFPSIHISVLRVVVTLVLCIPFIVFAIVLYSKIIINARQSKVLPMWAYKMWITGGIFVTPLFFLVNNYGTWFFAIAAYYLLTAIGFILMNNEDVIISFTQVFDSIRSKYKWLIILLLYEIFFTPIDNVKVGTFVNNFIQW